MLSYIKNVTRAIQEQRKTLAECGNDIDIVTECIRLQNKRRNLTLYSCSLGKQYISRTSQIVQDVHFECAVEKIQNGEEKELTVAERSSVCLLYTSPSPRDQRGSRMPSSA